MNAQQILNKIQILLEGKHGKSMSSLAFSGKNFTTGLWVLRKKANDRQTGPHQTKETANPEKKQSTELENNLLVHLTEG